MVCMLFKKKKKKKKEILELCTFYWKMQFLEKCIFLEKGYFFPGFFLLW